MKRWLMVRRLIRAGSGCGDRCRGPGRARTDPGHGGAGDARLDRRRAGADVRGRDDHGERPRRRPVLLQDHRDPGRSGRHRRPSIDRRSRGHGHDRRKLGDERGRQDSHGEAQAGHEEPVRQRARRRRLRLVLGAPLRGQGSRQVHGRRARHRRPGERREDRRPHGAHPAARADPDPLQDPRPELLRRAVRLRRGQAARDRRRALGEGVAAHQLGRLRAVSRRAGGARRRDHPGQEPELDRRAGALLRARDPEGGAGVRAPGWRCSRPARSTSPGD